jgi:ligand-binding sensor domain-containing protein
MRYYLFLVLLLAFPRPMQAQLPNLTLEHLTTKDGLPSNDVWCLTKDRQGFLWVGTGRTLCRYDGYTFQGLADLKLGHCSGVSTDSKGDIYASIDTKGLCRIDPQTLRATTVIVNEYDDTNPDNDLHEQGFVDSHDQVWVCDYTSVKRYDIATRKLHTYPLTISSGNGNVYQYASFFEDSRHTLWVISEIGLFRYDRPRNKLICELGPQAANPTHRIPLRLSKAFEDATGNLWIGSYDYGLIRFSPKNQSFLVMKREFEHKNVVCGAESRDENGRKILFIGTEAGLSLYYPDRNELIHLPEFYDNGTHVKEMYDDKTNGILWIGTREGLYTYRYRSIGIRTVAIPPNLVRLPVQVASILPIPNGEYLLGLSHSGALAWTPATNQFRFRRYPVSAETHQLRRIRGREFAFTNKGVFVGDAVTGQFSVWKPAASLFTSDDFRDGLLDRRGRFWVANLTEGLKVIDPVTDREIRLWSATEGHKLAKDCYVRAITEGADGRIWIATCSRGLFFFDEARARFVNLESLPGNKGRTAGDKGLILGGDCINAMQLADDGTILIASWGGVSKVSATGEILSTFEFKTAGLNDTYCSNIAEDSNGNLWFSTNEGIHIANPKTRAIRYVTTIEGLHSNYPFGFFYHRPNEIILGHINYLNVLTINEINKNKSVPTIALSGVEVKGKPLRQDLTQEIVLQPDSNSVSLHFSTLNFEPTSKSVYRYQLAGLDDNWVELGNQNSVSFANLPAKTYQLRVKSGNNAGVWNDAPMLINLRVLPHFTNTWWFMGLIGLLMGAVVVGLMRWRVQTLGERNRLDLQITELKLKALQSQMNPHFLFNSLNSVQNYLLTSQGLEGAKYLSKFSKLVRRIMENSNHQYLRFEQIIETLQMYVEIESFRFNHEFQYTFDIADDDLLLDALLPPMLLQPYVENAIWHGLMPKEGEKNLRISARVAENHIICIIEDNGVGRQYAPRTEGHVSRGQEMTKGIFESLRHKDSTATLEIIDLFDNQKNPIGTKVLMIIPIEKP